MSVIIISTENPATSHFIMELRNSTTADLNLPLRTRNRIEAKIRVKAKVKAKAKVRVVSSRNLSRSPPIGTTPNRAINNTTQPPKSTTVAGSTR